MTHIPFFVDCYFHCLCFVFGILALKVTMNTALLELSCCSNMFAILNTLPVSTETTTLQFWKILIRCFQKGNCVVEILFAMFHELRVLSNDIDIKIQVHSIP